LGSGAVWISTDLRAGLDLGMANKKKPVQTAKPKPTKKTNREDVNQAVARIVREATRD